MPVFGGDDWALVGLGFIMCQSVAGCGMWSLKGCSDVYRPLAVLLVFSSLAFANDAPPAKISPKTRQEVIHAFSDELVFIRTNFPMENQG